MLSGWAKSQRYRLAPDQTLPWLERYLQPALNHTPDWRRFWHGRYGASSWRFARS